MGLQAKYNSNLQNVLSTFRSNINNAMDECGPAGVESIKTEAPVKTGKLRESTKYERSTFDSVDFVNDAPYAAFVELGTYKQGANPFFRRGLFGALNRFKNIIFNNMKL
jgi:HK97 gp10 family phage protein